MNRDTGFGLCNRCLKFNGITETTVNTSSFGIRGIHFDLPEVICCTGCDNQFIKADGRCPCCDTVNKPGAVDGEATQP